MRSGRPLGSPSLAQLLLIFLVAFALSYVVSRYEEADRTQRKLDDLTRLAVVLADRIHSDRAPNDLRHMTDMLRRYERETGYRFTLIGADGMALADSRFRVKYVGDLSDQPDVAAALGAAGDPHARAALDREHGQLCASAPLSAQGVTARAVRVVVPASTVAVAFGDVMLWAGVLALCAWGISALCSMRTMHRVTEELARIGDVVRDFGQGRLSARVPPPTFREFSELAELLNSMAHRLDRERALMAEKQNERDAVLAGMVEGVIAVDLDDRLLTANRAAEQAFEFDAERSVGLPLQGVARNPELNRILEEMRTQGGMIRREVTLREPFERTLEVTATPLRDGQGYLIGALIVLHDITQIRRLERVRRDFVANVSHEIKTPVSTIHGAVETLLSGAADEPESRTRFLAMIERSAARLSAIIDDLLSLARLEETGGGRIPLKVQPLRPCLDEAVQDTSPLAEERGVSVQVSCSERLIAPISAPLMVQAVVNLLDNAIRHSSPGQTVELQAERVNSEVEIRVRDYGPGIEERHLPRLFERFYRVDTARSRKEGGTGLGLSIVKHVAQTHRGRVGVESVLGAGSTFVIRIPASTEPRKRSPTTGA